MFASEQRELCIELLRLLLFLTAGNSIFAIAAVVFERSVKNSPATSCWLWRFVVLSVIPLCVIWYAAPTISIGTTSDGSEMAPKSVRAPRSRSIELSRFASALEESQGDASAKAVESSSTLAASVGNGQLTLPSTEPTQRKSESRVKLAHVLPHWPFILVLIWATGATTQFLRLVWLMRHARSILQGCHKSRLQDFAFGIGLCGVRRLDVFVSNSVGVPLAVGWLFPKIILPAEARDWPEQRVRMAIAHELAHHERGDLFWQQFCQLASALLWFSPLILVARRKAIESRELACDEHVLSLGFEPADYAELLVQLTAKHANIPRGIQGAAPMSKPPLHGRINMILNWPTRQCKPQRWKNYLTVAMFALLLLMFGLFKPFAVPRAVGQEAAVKETPDEQLTDVKVTLVDRAGVPIRGGSVKLMQWTGDYEEISSARTSPEGHAEFAIRDASDNYYYLVFEADGYAMTMKQLQLFAGETKEVRFKMAEACHPKIKVLADGKPVAGAEASMLQYIDSNNNNVYLNYQTAKSLGIEWPSSDSDGILSLPQLPTGVTLTVSIAHPDWQTTKVEDLVASNSLVASATMESGVRVELDIGKTGHRLDGSRCGVLMLPVLSGKSNRVRHAFPILQGKVSFTASRVSYREIRLEFEDHFSSPYLVNYPEAPNKELDLRDQETARLKIDLMQKRKARGRIIDANGNGIEGALVVGSIVRPGVEPDAPRSNLAEAATNFAIGGNASTSQDGTFEIDLAEGVVEIETICEGYFKSPPTARFKWSGEINDALPTQTLLPIPELTGNVVDSEGQPVIGAIVRLKHHGRMDPDPVDQSSTDGSFTLKMRRLPYAGEGQGLETTVYALAFDPRTGDGGITEVDLTDPKSTSNIVVNVQPRSNDWPLEALKQKRKTEPAAQAELEEYFDTNRRKFAAGLPGNQVPNMSEGTWLNTDAKSLDDFRGKFVLLDFWFIGCGPCERDFPSVKLAHKTFYELGFTVVSVNTSGRETPDEVSRYALERGMKYPIVVDDAAETIASQFKPLGLSGFPHYMLLDPDGRIVFNDKLSEGSLRMSKLELIHKYVRDYRSQQE